MTWFVRTVEIPIYDIELVVVIHDDFNAVDKKYKLKLKEMYAPEDPNDCNAITHQHPDNYVEIYVLFDPNFLDIDVLAHETLHIVGYVCAIRGIKYDPANEEPLAYLQGFVEKEVAKVIVGYLDSHKMDLRKFLVPG